MIEAPDACGKDVSSGSIFSACPISLWEEDVTELSAHLERLRAVGAGDVRGYLDRHPGELRRCAGLIRVVAVNRATLDLYEAPDEPSLLAGLPKIFTDESLPAFREFVVAFAEGRRGWAAEGVTRTLRGKRIDVDLRWSRLPDCDGRPARVLLSVVDRTEQRRTAEAFRLEKEALRESRQTLATVIETAPS